MNVYQVFKFLWHNFIGVQHKLFDFLFVENARNLPEVERTYQLWMQTPISVVCFTTLRHLSYITLVYLED